MTQALDLRSVVDNLKEQRDHLRVRLHLAKVEVRDEWEALETQWEHVRAKLAGVGHEAESTAHEVGAALRLAVEELRRGYERIARRL